MSVRIEKSEAVTTIILDRPECRNAIDRPMAEALAEAFRAFEADDQAKVAVLWGDHGHFCAGADLKAVAAGNPVRVSEEGDGPLGCTRMHLSKPVIAAISGYAVAGGFELAIWADLRVMEDNATMGVYCRRWGIPLIDGGTIRLPRLIGQSRALDLTLTGRSVDATEAHSMGLINRVVEPGQARQAAETLAREISSFPQICMRGDRQSIYEQWDLSFESAIQNELKHGTKSLAKESLEGARRFAEGAGRHGKFENQSKEP